MAKPTQGPWLVTASEDEDGGYHVVAERALLDTVALVQPQPTDGEELANARLIAAAPDLLALAQQYATECGECAGTGVKPDDEPCDECTFIRGVIAKATGSAASDTGAK